jgi:hypothetical protein
MTTVSSAENIVPAGLTGGLAMTWLLGDEPRTITTKAGEKRTVVELRDPRRLSNSLVIWLDGEAEDLPKLAPGAAVSLHVQSVRGGRARGELVASVSRAVVSAALAEAGERSK